MLSSPVDLSEIFVRTPGDTIYFFAVIVICLISLLMIMSHRLNRSSDILASRYAFALGGMTLAWSSLLIGVIIALLVETDQAIAIIPLERAASSITIVLLMWALLTHESASANRRQVVLVTGFALLVVVGAGVTLRQWGELYGTTDFYLTELGATWIFVEAVLSGVGLVLVLLKARAVVDVPLKLLFFGLLLLGYAVTLAQIAEGGLIGNVAGVSRIAILVAYLLVPVIVYRLVVARFAADLADLEAAVRAPLPPRPARSQAERESVQLLRALGLILEGATAFELPQRVVKAVVEIFKADIAALLHLQDANYADVVVAHDHVMRRDISGIAINLDNQPTLASAIERRSQRQLSVSNNSSELSDLFTRLDVDQRGPVYFQPLTRDRELVAVLMLAFPYTQRELEGPEISLLSGFAVIAASMLALGYAADEARKMAEERAIYAMVTGVSPSQVDDDEVLAARRAMQAELQTARDHIEELNNHIRLLKHELEEERSRVAGELDDTEEGQTISQSILALNVEQQQLREERDLLASRLREAEAMLRSALGVEPEGEAHGLVEALHQERDMLARQRDELQVHIESLRTEGYASEPHNLQAQVEHMAQEKRRLEQECQQINAKLAEIHAQLQTIGIEEGSAGLLQLLDQLTEQRAELQNQNVSLQRERDHLLEERLKLATRIAEEEERDARLHRLESEVNNLAGDREAAIKQRDRLQAVYDDLLAKVDLIKGHRARLLAQAAGYEIELQEAHEEQNRLREELQKLANERSDLIHERDRLLAERHALQSDRDQLMGRVYGDRDSLADRGAEGINSLTAMIEQLTVERNQLEHELQHVRQKLADVENQYEALRMRMADTEDSAGRYKPADPELLLGLVQELRTPITSMTGYVDLLLGESAGILGEMQRKFLQRVASNISRLVLMLNDLIRVTELDTGAVSLSPEPVDVTGLVEDAITDLSSQFREKGLTVSLNLDDSLPSVPVDRDAIGQILGQLLSNAYLVSPPDSEVFVSVQRRQVKLIASAQPTDCLLISVGDRGGGISPEDEERVFARKYRAENPLIQGLGDTGVGMAIARALTEAHGGRMWLESREKVGSLFNVALPMRSEPEVER